MDFGKMLQESFDYAKEAVWEKWMKWILLIVSGIIFPLMWGYILEIVRGKKPAPELQNWVKLFVDGLKLLVIIIIYAIPVLIVLAIFGGFALFSAMAAGTTPYFIQPQRIMPLLVGFLIGIL
jgi:hydrogenase/urease accessory protein HupE